MTRTKTLRAALLLTMLVGAFGIGPARAETTTWTGSVTLFKPVGFPDHETAQYFLEDCAGDHPDAVFNAFIDVSDYQGQTLRFTPDANSPIWRLVDGTICGPAVAGSPMSTQSPIEWRSTGTFLSISFSDASPTEIAPVGHRYTLQVCPCDPT